jgi:EmrB/QacA subfamily drug resistance transporter
VITRASTAEPSVRLDRSTGRWILVATILGSSLAALDATAVNVALDRIGADLHADLAGLQWTIGGYALTLASFLLPGGALGDRLGRRRLFVLGTAWFALASALCGLAPSVATLVAARALQGVGGALLTPGSLAILAASFAPDDRSRAVGAWSGFTGIANAIGPLVGGWLVQAWSWRLVFLANLPLAAVVIAVASRHVPETRDPGAAAQLDVPGTLCGAVGLAALTWASIAAGDRGPSPAVLATGGAGVLALVAFVLVERRSPHPLVPPALFASRAFVVANLFTFLVYAAIAAVFFLLLLDLQVVGGYTPLAAGTSMLPVTVAMLALSPRSGALAQHLGPALQLGLGPLVAAVGVLLTVRIGADASWVGVVLPAVGLFGLGLATFVAPLTATVLAAAPSAHVGVASAVNNAVARVGGLLAVAALPALAGLAGEAPQDPAAFAAGYRTATLANVVLLVAGGVLAAVGFGREVRQAAAARADRHAYGCAVEGPRLETIDRLRAESAASVRPGAPAPP